MVARKYNRRVDLVVRPTSREISRKRFMGWLEAENFVCRKVKFRGLPAIHITVFVYCAGSAAVSVARAELAERLAGRCDYVVLECSHIAGISFVQPELLNLIPPEGIRPGARVKWSWRLGLRATRRTIQRNQNVSELVQSFCDSVVEDAPLIELGSTATSVPGYTYQPDVELPLRQRSTSFISAYLAMCFVDVAAGVWASHHAYMRVWVILIALFLSPLFLWIPKADSLRKGSAYLAGIFLSLFLVPAGMLIHMPPGLSRLGNPLFLAFMVTFSLSGVYRFWISNATWRPTFILSMIPFVPVVCVAMATENWRARLGAFPFPVAIVRGDSLELIGDCLPWYFAVILCLVAGFGIVGWCQYMGLAASGFSRRMAAFMAIILASIMSLGMIVRMSVAQSEFGYESARNIIRTSTIAEQYSMNFNVSCIRSISGNQSLAAKGSFPGLDEPVLVVHGTDGNLWVWRYTRSSWHDSRSQWGRDVVVLPPSSVVIVRAVGGKCR